MVSITGSDLAESLLFYGSILRANLSVHAARKDLESSGFRQMHQHQLIVHCQRIHQHMLRPLDLGLPNRLCLALADVHDTEDLDLGRF